MGMLLYGEEEEGWQLLIDVLEYEYLLVRCERRGLRTMVIGDLGSMCKVWLDRTVIKGCSRFFCDVKKQASTSLSTYLPPHSKQNKS